MLELDAGGSEFYDEERNEFIYVKPVRLRLEHSLISLSKWEAKWRKPLLEMREFTLEEFSSYVRCMTLNQNVDPMVYQTLTTADYAAVQAYMGDSHTATTFSDNTPRTLNREIMTAELIYYYMVAYRVPFECQKWHLGRLITLLRICGIKNQPERKISQRDLADRNRRLNELRRKRLNTKG